MTLFCIIVALVIEQYRPLPAQRWVLAPLARYFAFFDRQFNDGQYRHGIVAWLAACAAPALLLTLMTWWLDGHNTIVNLLLSVALLYLTMGFRQFSHHFTDIQQALRTSDLEHARKVLADWRGVSADRLSSNEIARLAIEQALVASHRHVIAPLICFGIFGPGGALLYRLALFAQEYWKDNSSAARFGQFSHKAFRIINWLPLRLTAVGFAVTGDFEDAIFCWRTQSANWAEPENGILLASGGGALGVRLGLPVQDAMGTVQERPEMGLGDEADADFMQSTVGLVWRTLIFCLLILALFWVSGAG